MHRQRQNFRQTQNRHAEIITEEVTIGKIIVEITAGIEVDKTLGEIIVMTEVD